MKLKSIKIQNYKSLENVEINNLGNLVAFIGPNMAGKSNVFDALWLVHEGLVENLKYAIEDRRSSFDDIVWRKNVGEKITISLLFETTEAFRNGLLSPFFLSEDEFFGSRIHSSDFLRFINYQLVFKLSEPSLFFEEKLTTSNIDSGKSELVMFMKYLNLQNRNIESRITNVEPQFEKIIKSDSNKFSGNLRDKSSQSWDTNSLKLAFNSEYYSGITGIEAKVIERFTTFISSIKWLSPFKNIQNIISIAEDQTLKFDASNLANVIHFLNSNSPSKFAKILPLLKSIIPEIMRISTPIIGNGTTVGMEEGNQSAIVYKLSGFSAGMKNILAIISLLLLSDKEELVFIEEPEIHIHPGALKNLIVIFKEFAKDKQVFISTHSPAVLLNFSINDIRFVKRNDAGNTIIEVPDSESAREIVYQLGIRPSDFLDYDLIIFVEGIYDELIFKEFAAKSNIDTIGVCFIPTNGWSNMEYYSNCDILQRRRVCPKIIAVFDGDLEKRSRAKREKENMLKRMEVPEDNVFNLKLGEIECYLLDVEAWFRAWPSLKEKVSEEELKNEFEKIKQSEKQKECLEKLMERLGLESYKGEIAIKIVNNMSSVPDEIEGILKHAKNLIGENSK